uniref:(northern house mosquito) hypothetical protein n=1 Tax=Culex pipiens TaxID=7175 RepID=A0A8D8AGB6_CULPI
MSHLVRFYAQVALISFFKIFSRCNVDITFQLSLIILLSAVPRAPRTGRGLGPDGALPGAVHLQILARRAGRPPLPADGTATKHAREPRVHRGDHVRDVQRAGVVHRSASRAGPGRQLGVPSGGGAHPYGNRRRQRGRCDARHSGGRGLRDRILHQAHPDRRS